MSDNRLALLVRWGMLASLTLLIIKIAIDLVEHPPVITTAGRSGLAYMILLALAVLIYGWFALFQTRAAADEDRVALRVGTFWGVLCGLAWAAELMLANLPFVQTVWFNHALYYVTAFAGFFMPLIAGLRVVYLTNKIGPGLQAGLLCGMAGGLIIFLTYQIFTNLFNASQDPQMIAEFQRSGLPDITTYIVGDTLAGIIAHLWIGIVTGISLGLIGGVMGNAATKLTKE